MAKYSTTQAAEAEDALDQDEDFFFDDEEDEFMERSQRKLLQAKRERVPRMKDY
jgi:hypothetical protein